MLESWIRRARAEGASDLHLEAGQPAALRVNGALRLVGEPLDPEALLEAARALVPPEEWASFLSRRSYDLSRAVAGVACRVNVLQSARGVGMAVRLLPSSRPTLDSLNLHPSLADLVQQHHGLILVCGPTGSGKSSTVAALVHALTRPSHVVSIEDPIEYILRPARCLVRQREVGRHTPSFEQALRDALREDPDVVVVGELREPEVMRLTLDAAETGHLVLTTLHAATPSEALARMVSAFPAEAQDGVRAQLAGSLVAVLTQHLTFRPALGFRVPECAVLRATSAVRAQLREGAFHKLNSTLELSAGEGMWTRERYARWLDSRTRWTRPSDQPSAEEPAQRSAPLPGLPPPRSAPPVASQGPGDNTFDLDGADTDLDALIDQLKGRGR